MAEALADIRKALGEEAVIVSTTNTSEGIVITAAADVFDLAPSPSTGHSAALDYMSLIDQICEYHRTPKIISSLWKENIANFVGRSSVPLETSLSSFIPIDSTWLEKLTASDPILLAGPPGAGKSVVLAKITAGLLSLGKHPKVITTDDKKSGAIAQMDAYMKAMNVRPQLIKHPDSLRTAYLNLKPGQVMVVDTPATNPYNRQDISFLKSYAQALNSPLTLVLPANIDAEEAAEMARSYKEAKAKNVIITHLDTCKRLGAVLSACHAAELTLVSMTKNPRIGDGIHAFTSSTLTKMLTKNIPGYKEAAS